MSSPESPELGISSRILAAVVPSNLFHCNHPLKLFLSITPLVIVWSHSKLSGLKLTMPHCDKRLLSILVGASLDSEDLCTCNKIYEVALGKVWEFQNFKNCLNSYSGYRTSGIDRFIDIISLAMMLNWCSLNRFSASSFRCFGITTGLPDEILMDFIWIKNNVEIELNRAKITHIARLFRAAYWSWCRFPFD